MIPEQSTPETPDLNALHWARTWFGALTRPTQAGYETLFDGIRGRRTIASLWVVTGAVVAAILTMFTYEADLNFVMIGIVCSIPVFSGIYLGLTGLTAWSATRIAARQGGGGDFDTQMIALGAIVAPMSILTAAVYLVPFGSLIALALLIYWNYLTVLAVKVVNRLSWGGALLASVVFIGLSLLALVLAVGLGLLSARLPGNL